MDSSSIAPGGRAPRGEAGRQGALKGKPGPRSTAARHAVSRRREGAIAAACWLAAGVAPLRYTFLLGIVLMINAGLVIASTAVGGLLVEVSRRYDASARLVPMRSVVTRACLLVGGPLGGFLATFAFGLSTTICAVIALLVVPIAMIWLHERAAPKDSLLAWQNAKRQIRGLLRSRSVWGFAALAFLG